MGVFENIMNNINNSINRMQLENDKIILGEQQVQIIDKEYEENLKYLQMDLTNLLQRKQQQEQLINSYVDSGLTIQDKIYKDAFHTYQKIKYDITETEKKMQYLRPNNEQDITYRKKQMQEFSERLRGVLPNDSNLRFHGAPCYYAEDIIRSKKITSTAERFNGYNRSFDSVGIISVTDINSLDSTVKTFSGLDGFSENLPAGCIFVIRDEKNSFQADTFSMDSVDFGTNPKLLYGIITTPENINNISQALLEAGLPINKVYTFDDFLRVVEKDVKRQEIRQEDRNYAPNIDEEIRMAIDAKQKEHDNFIATIADKEKNNGEIR